MRVGVSRNAVLPGSVIVSGKYMWFRPGIGCLLSTGVGVLDLFSSSTRLFRTIILIGHVCFLGACSTVYVQNAEVVKEKYLGLLVLKVQPGVDYASVVITNGFGLTVGAQSTTLGYLSESVFMASSGSACRAIVIVNSDSELQNLKRLLAELPGPGQLCVFTKEGKS